MIENKKLVIYAGIFLVCLVFFYFNSGVSFLPPDEIDYQGEKVKLSKYYLDYDSYKNDPENIDPSELGKIEKLIMELPVQTVFHDRESMIRAMFELKFPGYGLGCFGEKVQDDGNLFAGYSIEIPKANKERVIVYHKRNESYYLIDDFISPVVDYVDIMGIKKVNDDLIYCTVSGETVVVRPLNKEAWE